MCTPALVHTNSHTKGDLYIVSCYNSISTGSGVRSRTRIRTLAVMYDLRRSTDVRFKIPIR